MKPTQTLPAAGVLIALAVFGLACGEEPLNTPPPGFKALFNGKDLTGWKGQVGNPIERAKMSPEELIKRQAEADEKMRAHWSVQDGILLFDGKGDNLCTAKDYGDFELFLDFKLEENGDSGVYLRGTPQVQIWDTKLFNTGSGGLYNNQKHPSKPLSMADRPIGQWNTLFIRMVGERVTVKLNGQLVVDNVVLENYWDRSQPVFATGPIELQNHGNRLYFRNIYIKELVPAEGVGRIHESTPTAARAKPKQPRNVLVYTHAAGFVHSSIPFGAHAVELLGRRSGAFEAIISNNPAMFDAENLKPFDAIVLVNTTGDWLLPRGEEFQRLSAAEQEQARAQAEQRKKNILEFVSGGKGLVGFHAASDSNYSWADFGQMIGGYFDGHPWHEKVGVRVEESSHPLLAAFEGQNFTITDEIYQFKAPYSRENLRVLLSLDNNSIDVKKGKRADSDYAVAWIRQFGKGRVFYSSLGHREEIYWNTKILQFYLDGIQYALGDLEADATPSAKVRQ
jgi:type 1 glutamine amidotransferase